MICRVVLSLVCEIWIKKNCECQLLRLLCRQVPVLCQAVCHEATFFSQVTKAASSFHSHQPLCFRLPTLFVFPRSDPSRSWVIEFFTRQSFGQRTCMLIKGQAFPVTHPTSHRWLRDGFSRNHSGRLTVFLFPGTQFKDSQSEYKT